MKWKASHVDIWRGKIWRTKAVNKGINFAWQTNHKKPCDLAAMCLLPFPFPSCSLEYRYRTCRGGSHLSILRTRIVSGVTLHRSDPRSAIAKLSHCFSNYLWQRSSCFPPNTLLVNAFVKYHEVKSSHLSVFVGSASVDSTNCESNILEKIFQKVPEKQNLSYNIPTTSIYIIFTTTYITFACIWYLEMIYGRMCVGYLQIWCHFI